MTGFFCCWFLIAIIGNAIVAAAAAAEDLTLNLNHFERLLNLVWVTAAFLWIATKKLSKKYYVSAENC